MLQAYRINRAVKLAFRPLLGWLRYWKDVLAHSNKL